jgi:hypothetical protein
MFQVFKSDILSFNWTTLESTLLNFVSSSLMLRQNKGSCVLAKFVGEYVSDIAPSLLALAISIISICVASPKVAKASTIVTVTRH